LVLFEKINMTRHQFSFLAKSQKITTLEQKVKEKEDEIKGEFSLIYIANP